MEKEILLVEELENLILENLIKMQGHLSNICEIHPTELNFFDNYFSGELLSNFTKIIYRRIKILNSFALNEFLQLSILQFSNYNPEKREKELRAKFRNLLPYPIMKGSEIAKRRSDFLEIIIYYYNQYFYLFHEATLKVRNEIKNDLLGNKSRKSEQPQNLKSFEYIRIEKQPENIMYLFDDLKKGNFIFEDTKLNDFKKVFSKKIIVEKIVWTGTISELNYFIKMLHNVQNKVVDLKKNHWKVAALCFTLPDKLAIDPKLLKVQKKPSKVEMLEKIVSRL